MADQLALVFLVLAGVATPAVLFAIGLCAQMRARLRHSGVVRG